MSDSTTTNGNSLKFRFEPDTRPKSRSLQNQVQQIISQKGAFRNITETSLHEELNRSNTDNDGRMQVDDEESSEEEESLQTRQEQLWKSREETLQKLSYAQNEVLSALDFISLLLSNSSRGAQASMSPALKAVVQPGTLEGRLVEVKQLTPKTRTVLTKVSDGWKSTSFASAAEKLKKSSSNLDGEAERQAKYWDQVAHLKSTGWVISRLPSDSRAIGVHFGFPESAPQFRNRGFALLQQDDSGDVDIDPRSLPKKTDSIKVAVWRRGQETGSFVRPLSSIEKQSEVHGKLLRARDSLFEEELFYEINREARLIANQGVRTQAQSLEADIGKEYLIKISYSKTHDLTKSIGLQADNQIAQFVALALRLLLESEHRRLRHKRSTPPNPMTLAQPSIPEYAILRPIVAHLRHHLAVRSFLQLCQVYTACLKQMGFQYDAVSKIDESQMLNLNNRAQLDVLKKPAKSSVSLHIELKKILTLDVETYLGSPLYGTTYKSTELDYGFARIPASTMRTLEEVTEFLTHVVILEVVAKLKDLSNTLQASHDVEWTIARPHSGEYIVSKATRNVAKVNVSLEKGRIVLQTISKALPDSLPKKVIYVWTAQGFETLPVEESSSGGDKTLADVVRTLNEFLSKPTS